LISNLQRLRLGDEKRKKNEDEEETTGRKYMSASATQSGHNQLEMWANAQRDDRPAKYRWCPLFNAAKFG